MSKKIIILGATGFLGSEIVGALCKKNNELMVMVRDVEKANRLFAHLLAHKNHKLQISKWNFESQAFIIFLQEAHIVINLTGESIADKPWTAEQKKKLRDSRVEPINLLSACLKNNRKKKLPFYLGASAIGYYPFDEDKNLIETSHPGKHFLSELCCIWEEMHATVPARRSVILRIGVVLGANGGMMKKLLPIFKWGLGASLGNGKQYFSWISIIDLVKIVLTACSNDAYKGTYNAVSPHIITNAFFTKVMAHFLKRLVFFSAPAFVIKWLFGSRSILLLSGQKIYPAALKKQGFVFTHENFLDAAKTLSGKN